MAAVAQWNEVMWCPQWMNLERKKLKL